MDFYDDGPIVCTVHLRFIPCRRCRGEYEAERWSEDPRAVAIVSAYQNDELTKDEALVELSHLDPEQL